MKTFLLNFWRRIVGSEYGFTGEGNEQWYYTLAVIINLMLVWCLKPEIAIVFTVLTIIHFLTLFIYGFLDFDLAAPFYKFIKPDFIYLGIHCIIIVIAAITNIKWTLITAIGPTIAYCMAPDCTGNNIFNRDSEVKGYLILFQHTIVFTLFVVIDFLLPMNLFVKFIIIIGALLIHPVIDYLEGECIIINEITNSVFYDIRDYIKEKKNKKKKVEIE